MFDVDNNNTDDADGDGFDIYFELLSTISYYWCQKRV